MGLFVLLAALAETISDTIKESVRSQQAQERRRRYEDIAFDNIQSVVFHGTEQAYAFEVEEEYDPMASYGLSQMNGAPCYATKEVLYKVENGLNYCFTIRYKDGTEIYRVFHESSPLTQRLLDFQNKAPGRIVINFADGRRQIFDFDDVDSEPVCTEETWHKNPTFDYDAVYTYCKVSFDGNEKSYYYRTKNSDFKVGDNVYVPVGYKNEKKIGTIVSVEDFVGWNAPYPLEKTKMIIGKVE